MTELTMADLDFIGTILTVRVAEKYDEHIQSRETGGSLVWSVEGTLCKRMIAKIWAVQDAMREKDKLPK